MAFQSITLQDFLQKHFITKENPKPITNTRIADKSLKISGGSYHIPDEEYDTFLELYYRDVIARGNSEYITEKQRNEDGPVAIDLDFRYDYDVETRQHSEDHIIDFISLYLDELKKVYEFNEETLINVYVFEKPTVNRVEEKQITKDGIHIIMGLQVERETQLYIRNKIVKELENMWEDLPLKNSWDDVFDNSVSAGFSNWQLYGSRKPNNQMYQLSQIKAYKYDKTENDFYCLTREETMYGGRLPSLIELKELLPKLSVRCKTYPKYGYNSGYEPCVIGSSTPKRSNSGINLSMNGLCNNKNINYISSIKNKNDLINAINVFLDSLTVIEYEIREAHNYAMILPSKYWGKGSYEKWIRVGWALRNINDALFITWIAFSAQSADFSFSSDISNLYEYWIKFDMGNPEGLTKRSIIYWAKQDAHKEFEEVRKTSIEYYIDQTLNTAIQNSFSSDKKISGSTDFDMAMVLYQLFKDEYICVNVRNNIWYRYENHRWKETDSGTHLRKSISMELRSFYVKKLMELLRQISEIKDQEDKSELCKRLELRANKVQEIIIRLGKTVDKKNIMTEAKDIFYDIDFLKRLDKNPYLLCFNNGVLDLQNKVFRKGYPDDYISKTTKIDYIANGVSVNPEIAGEINDFMEKLFPKPELRRYMWEHFASIIYGTPINQQMFFYLGGGSNGKSCIINLLEMCLGTYYVSVPITLITQQTRTKIGGLAPELVSLKGARLAVMSEVSKTDKINEGPMKEMVGGNDVITCRAPYMTEMISYIPQFSLVVCCNVLPEIMSNDYGTWRRIRICPFESMFCENPVMNDPEKPYQFKIDSKLTEKFDIWKEIFMSMCINKAFETNGKITDCEIVLSASNKYKQDQDFISQFVADKIIRQEGARLLKNELSQEFNIWFKMNNGGKIVPNIKEVVDYIDKNITRFNKTKSCWAGIMLRYENSYGMETFEEDMEEDGLTSAGAETAEDYGL